MVEIVQGPPHHEHMSMFSIYPGGAAHDLNNLNCENCGRIVTSFWTGDPEQNNFEYFLNEILDHLQKYHTPEPENN